MNNHWLTIIESGVPRPRFAMNGNYIIGRIESRCREIAHAFDDEPTLIIFNDVRRLSGIHCVLLADDMGYQIIDGWGDYFSTNGIYCNGQKIDFAILKHDDLIAVGCQEINLLYENERDVQEGEKATISQVY